MLFSSLSKCLSIVSISLTRSYSQKIGDRSFCDDYDCNLRFNNKRRIVYRLQPIYGFWQTRNSITSKLIAWTRIIGWKLKNIWNKWNKFAEGSKKYCFIYCDCKLRRYFISNNEVQIAFQTINVCIKTLNNII